MRRILSGVMAAGFAATVVVAAQERPGGAATPQGAAGAPSSQQPEPREQARAAAGQAVIVSGCIQKGPVSSQATAQAGQAQATAQASGQAFVLQNAKPASGTGAAGGAVGTTGTTASRYELDGNTAELQKHLGHQVEITGTVMPGSTAATAGGGAGQASAVPRLKVTSIKMVSDKCS